MCVELEWSYCFGFVVLFTPSRYSGYNTPRQKLKFQKDVCFQAWIIVKHDLARNQQTLCATEGIIPVCFLYLANIPLKISFRDLLKIADLLKAFLKLLQRLYWYYSNVSCYKSIYTNKHAYFMVRLVKCKIIILPIIIFNSCRKPQHLHHDYSYDFQ